jgi:hypothetical protein
MANKSQHDEFFGLLRRRGVRKKLAKRVAGLEGNSRRDGAKGAATAEKAVEDLTEAAADIRRRVLHKDSRRSRGARKAAQTRARNTTKRSTSAKKGARTRASVSRARTRASAGSARTRATTGRARTRASKARR